MDDGKVCCFFLESPRFSFTPSGWLNFFSTKNFDQKRDVHQSSRIFWLFHVILLESVFTFVVLEGYFSSMCWSNLFSIYLDCCHSYHRKKGKQKQETERNFFFVIQSQTQTFSNIFDPFFSSTPLKFLQFSSDDRGCL